MYPQSSSVISVLDNDQVGISDIQRRAILSELHFHNILFAGFSHEASQEFEDVFIRKLAIAANGS